MINQHQQAFLAMLTEAGDDDEDDVSACGFVCGGVCAGMGPACTWGLVGLSGVLRCVGRAPDVVAALREWRGKAGGGG